MEKTVDIWGIRWPHMVSENALNAIKNFQVRDDDVWIATWPKAGTHWMAEICQLIRSNGDLASVDREQAPMPLEFESMDKAKPPRYQAAPSWKSPRVLVTHVPKQLLPDQLRAEQTKAKVITVIRNLKDTLVSFHFFRKGMAPGNNTTFEDSFQKFLLADKVEFTSWFDHSLGYWADRHNKRNLVLKYEDMKRDTRGAVVQIADFLERPLADDVIDKIVDLVTVKSMKTRYHKEGELPDPSRQKIGAPNLVRKGIVGDWKTTFTVAQNEVFDEFYRDKMAGSDLKMEFE